MIGQQEILEKQYRCSKNCGKESMNYDEAYQHLFTCTVSNTKTKIELLLDQLNGEDKPVEWNDSSRCVR